jgi:hypothetical protein
VADRRRRRARLAGAIAGEYRRAREGCGFVILLQSLPGGEFCRTGGTYHFLKELLPESCCKEHAQTALPDMCMPERSVVNR